MLTVFRSMTVILQSIVGDHGVTGTTALRVLYMAKEGYVNTDAVGFTHTLIYVLEHKHIHQG